VAHIQISFKVYSSSSLTLNVSAQYKAVLGAFFELMQSKGADVWR
jgi:hypothetical protein